MTTVKDAARCFGCENALGKPLKTVEFNEEMHTIYQCPNCEQSWYRSHD